MKQLKKENLQLKLKLERAEELLNLYRHDSMTGLKMRRDFEARFTEFFESGIEFYLTIVDVNGLHNLNRDEDMDAGDRLIKSVASKFMNLSNGIVYRIGGDEFAGLSLEEPSCPSDDPTFVCAWVSNKTFKSERSMFKSCDRKLIQGKEDYYKSSNHNRRDRQREDG